MFQKSGWKMAEIKLFIAVFVNKAKVDYVGFESSHAGTIKAWHGAHTSGSDLWRPRIFGCINYGMVYEIGFVTYPFK